MIDDADTLPLLSIGIIAGGLSAKNRDSYDALNSVQRLVSEESSVVPNRGLRLNVVFHLPGPLLRPDYQGTHLTRLDVAHSRALVVSAVPEDLTRASVPTFVSGVLRDSIDQIQTSAAKRRLGTLDVDDLERAIDRIVLKLAELGPA